MRAAAAMALSALRRRPSSWPAVSILCCCAHFEAAAAELRRKSRTRIRRLLGEGLPDAWESSGSESRPSVRKVPSTFGVSPLSEVVQPHIVDGKVIAEELRTQIAEEVQQMKDAVGKVPGLAVILVGRRRDSQSYVRYKIKGCQEVGIKSVVAELPEDCTEDEVAHSISSFNADSSVHGVLVQLPLPQHLNEDKILSAISLEKDVDGFHPINVGNLALRGREPLFIPCAAKACVEILLRTGLDLSEKHVAVIGRSKVVGLPVSLLLQRHQATVSIIHACTENPETITCEADIVIAAAGVANLVRGSWLKENSIVIDVGTNPVEDPDAEHGYRLTGDVCFEEAVNVSSIVTPVPGGVGPVTIAMLLSSTVDSAKRFYGLMD